MKKFILLFVILSVAALAVGLVACNKATVVKVEIADEPTKTIYYEGEVLDLTGCTIHVVYSNNEVKTVDVTSDMVSAFDSTGVGPRSLTVTYREGGASYSTVLGLRVVSRPASALSVAKAPDCTTFVEGQTVDVTGLEVEVYYTDEQRHVVTTVDLGYVPVVAQLGMTSVRVTLGNLGLDVPITVVPVAVSGIRASLLDGYVYRNEVLKPTLFDVQFVYNNGETESAVNWTLQEAGRVVDAIGTYSLHLAATHSQYGEFSCTVEVQSAEDEVVQVRLADAPMLYAVGDAFSWQQITFSVDFVHSRGIDYALGRDTYAGITLDLADGTLLEESGARTVTVLAGGRALATFRIAVGVVAPVRWVVEQGGDDYVQCSVGQVPLPTTLILYAVLSDGSRRMVWHNFAAPAGVEVTLPEPAVSGQQTACLVYEGLAYTYRISVVS